MTALVGSIALARVKDTLTSLPKWVYIAAGIALALLLAAWWHSNKVEAFEKAIRADEQANIAAKAEAIAKQARELSLKLRTLSDDKNRRIDDRARSVLVLGPGKAACTAPTPAASSGREQASGPGNAALPRVPYPEWQSLIGMPFTSTVEFARLCDANRSEVLSWRDWHKANDALMQGSKP